MAANVASSKMHYNASSVSNILAITSLCLILTSTFAIGASPPKSSTLQAANNQQANLTQTRTTGDTKTPSKTNSGTQQKQQVSIVDQQQESPTDISSMYVQIPIAEPNDAGIQETSGQQASSDGSPADGSAASSSGESSSWTGPWPKKFQIGYIKQSDLHQVLIDSLKNDPFVSIGTPNKPSPAKQSAGSSALATPAPGKASKTNAPVETKTLMVPRQAAPMAQWPAAPYNGQQQQIQRPNSNKNAYVFQAQQHAKLSHQPSFAQMNQRAIPHHQQAHRSQQRPAPFSNQQHNFNGQHHNQAQDQFQFANFPPNQIKNQPMYTINSFPNHMEHELHHMQHNRQLQHLQSLFGQQQAHSAKPTKSNEYYSSSWRPVTNEKPGDELGFQQQQQQQAAKSMSQADFQNLNDGFDDGFNSPSKDAVSGTSMNRHPMLNSYLGSMTNSNQGADASLGAGKMSPPMNNAARDQQVDISGQFATKSAPKTTGSTKSSAPRGTADGSTKSTREISGVKTGTKQSDDGMVLSNDKRNLNGTANSTEASLTTTVSSTLADENFANTTTMSPLSTNTGNGTTSTSAPTTTQSTGDEETTTDSDVVTVETETSNEPTESTTTASTTTASTASADGAETSTNSGQTTSSTPAADSQRSAGEKGGQENVGSQDLGETATQSPINSRPTDSSNETSTTTSTQSPRSSGSTTTSSQREETTPSAQSEARAGEVEGARMEKNAKLDSMSDEALMATAVKTSDIGKTNNLTRQRAAAGSTTKKLVRSSERLINQANQQTSGRKGGQQQANKLITKKPPSSPSSNRSGKQVSEPIGTKGTSKSLASTKSANIKNSSSSKRKSSSSNNQQQQRWKGQASGGPKITRMAQASERLTQQPQVVSMSAAQAQSTAQTLASLLLARCMSSSSCSHLLDMCTTKQAMIPLESVTSNSAEPTSTSTTLKPSSDVSTSANWSMPVGLMSNSLMSLTQALQADKVLKLFPQWKDQVENIVDQDTQTGYTLILPSNEAIERLPMATIDSWLGNQDLLAQVIDNHIIDSAETIEIVSSDASRTPTRMLRNKGLQINQHKNKLVTINGKRLVYANQAAPSGGRIHVIDGVLDWPSGNGKLLDIMDTLKQCDKFDGFVTLAEGTGLNQILKQDGPMTVFVPSNEALRKIPDEELDIIKNNNTALKEFLMYHVVNGSYFSQDLRDGQQLASILNMKPIQVGVRVDGCSRRLVEANTSPMRRPDIVAKNGVVHILDWYLTVRDNDWCDSISSNSIAGSSAPAPLGATSSERLQQLASSDSGYATRMTLPANHKPANENSLQSAAAAAASTINQNAKRFLSPVVSSGSSPATGSISTDNLDSASNNIIIMATAVGDSSKAAAKA